MLNPLSFKIAPGRVLALAAALVAALSATPASALPASAATAPAAACRFAGEPRQWTAQALDAWARLDRQRLRIARPVTPTIALFDQACVYRLTPDRRGDFAAGGRRYRTTAQAHAGQVAIPDGSTVPARRLAFAAPTSDGGMFFIMALPSLWRDDTQESRDPRLLAMVVFMHEFTHTQQSDGLGARIDRLLSLGLPPDANDDVIQDRFGDRPGYRQAWESERDALYAAVQAPHPEVAVALADGLERMRARRSRWFTGDEAFYAEADDVFLTLEGTGNWSAWAWLIDPRGGGLSRQDAIVFVRGGSGHWSQDQGLALMLAIDRLTPDWPRLAFGPDAFTAEQMARRALR